MKFWINALIAFVFVFEQAFTVQPAVTTSAQSVTPTAVATATPTGNYGAYPPPVMPTAAPTSAARQVTATRPGAEEHGATDAGSHRHTDTWRDAYPGTQPNPHAAA